MANNITTEAIFEQQCIVDEAKVFYVGPRIYRAIYSTSQATLYKNLFEKLNFEELFDAGLVRTTIAGGITLDNCELILEHEKIDYFIDPCEMTDTMFFEAAKSYVAINKILSKHGLILKDSHPWNITFKKGRPVFFDFSSIKDLSVVSQTWFEEFYTYFAFPIMLASSKWANLSIEYRRQHLNGFGLKLSENDLIKKKFFKSFFKLKKTFATPTQFFDKLESWLLKLKPQGQIGVWDDYNQAHENHYSNPQTLKQKFVYEILKTHKPLKVTDLATNKGYYAFMAESLGASVIGFDYESNSVDFANRIIGKKNISFCQMNFITPTPRKGWGLVIPGAFERFRGEIAFALGLIHHICLVQGFPVKLFCETCAKYSSKGVILEFVFPEDIHVKGWNVGIPEDYKIETIKSYFRSHYENVIESDMLVNDGVLRQFLFFYS